MNEKTGKNQVQQQNSYQRDKRLDSSACKVFWIISKMDQGWTQTNELKDKKADDVHPSDVSRKEGRGPACIKDCVDAPIQGVEDYIKKSKERLIKAADNRIGNINCQESNKNRNRKKNFCRIFQATNWRDCTYEDMEMATKRKRKKRN